MHCHKCPYCAGTQLKVITGEDQGKRKKKRKEKLDETSQLQSLMCEQCQYYMQCECHCDVCICAYIYAYYVVTRTVVYPK